MADIRELIPLAQRPGQSSAGLHGMFYGTVAYPVPAVPTSPMYVILPDVSHEHSFGPCRWEPRCDKKTINVAQGAETANNFVVGDMKVPSFGDEALVAFDNRQQPWVVMWWPLT